MSIIIRLQNLPWAANSVDIRRYFSGLSIPEGGVHIVGGEKGDAFIAFSTDEDARQAMERDGGKIKEIKIKLLLSSRTEMQRVIEQARNQNVVLQSVSSASPTIKASATDSDRRSLSVKVPEKDPSPPRRKDKEKSPGGSSRDRGRRSKRDRSRSASRSPIRRSRERERDRDRDSDRRDRSKRDERRSQDSRSRDERGGRNSKESNSRQDQQKRPVPNGEVDSQFASRIIPTLSQPPSNESQFETQPVSNQPPPGPAPYESTRPPSDQRSAEPQYYNSRTSNQDESQPAPYDPRALPQQDVITPSPHYDPRGFHGHATIQPYNARPPAPGMSGDFPDPYDSKLPPPAASVHDLQPPYEDRMIPTSHSSEQMHQFDKRPLPPSNVTGQPPVYANRPVPLNQSSNLGPPMPFDNWLKPTNPQGAPPYEKRPLPTPPPGPPPPVVYENKHPSTSQNAVVYDKRLQPPVPPAGSPTPYDKRNAPSHQSAPSVPYDKRPLSTNQQASASPPHFNKRPVVMNEPFRHQEDIHGPVRDPSYGGPNGMPPWMRNHPSQNERGHWEEGRRTLLSSPAADVPDPYHEQLPDEHLRDNPNISLDRNIPPSKGPFSLDGDRDPYAPPPPQYEGPTDRRRIHPGKPGAGDGYGRQFPQRSDNNRLQNYTFEDQSSHPREPLMAAPRRPAPLIDREEQPISMPPRGPPSLCVELKGLPYDVSNNDIRQFFRGLFIPPDGIKILLDEHGQPNGIGFVRFANDRDSNNALRRSMQYIGKASVEVYRCPEEVFDSAPISHGPSGPRKPPVIPPYQAPRRLLKPREEDLCVFLKGLPYMCKEEDVINFFHGLGILDVHIEYDQNGKALGRGFVEFSTPEDFHAALGMNGNMIGHRYIDVSVGSKEMMMAARGGPDAPRPPEPVPGENGPSKELLPVPHPPPPLPAAPTTPSVRPPQRELLPPPARPPAGGRPPLCISLRELPLNVTDHDIADFFAEVGVVPRAIHIMLGPNKLPSGDAFAEFGNHDEFDRGLKKNGKYINDIPVVVTPIAYWEMVEILGGPQNVPPPPLLDKPPEEESIPRRPLIEPPEKGRGLMEPPGGHPEPMDIDDDRPPLEMMPREQGRSLLDADRRPEEHMEGPLKGRSPLPRMPGPRGFPRMGPPGPGMRPPRPMGGERMPRMPFQPRFRPPPPDRLRNPMNPDSGPDKFGKPGCVVALNNVHFNAGLEDLLHFFQEYGLNKDNLIRKYNDKGQPTGEARVCFRTPEDAQKAVHELHMKTLLGRSVVMHLI